MTIMAFDLETVPDVRAGQRVWGLTGTDEEIAAAMIARRQEESEGRTDFLKPPFHRIVGLGLVRIEVKGGTVVECSAEGYAGESESVLLGHFFRAMFDLPQLVSWNGGGFDLPAIRFRSLIHQIPSGRLEGPLGAKPWEQYLNRYGDRHVDLMDVLSGYGASAKLSLHEAARLCGLPGKGAVDGSQVANLARGGEWDEIRNYVKSDALQTLLLFLLWMKNRGVLADAFVSEGIPALRAELDRLNLVPA